MRAAVCGVKRKVGLLASLRHRHCMAQSPRLFVCFRGAVRNGLRASIPAYRDMQLEAHRIQDTQNGFEIWMLRFAFKGAIDRRSFEPGTLAMSEMLYRRMAAPMA